jgi:hypothetical protein
MLNWALLKHPLNWLTVFLMVFIGGIVLNLALTPWHQKSAANNPHLSTT